MSNNTQHKFRLGVQGHAPSPFLRLAADATSSEGFSGVFFIKIRGRRKERRDAGVQLRTDVTQKSTARCRQAHDTTLQVLIQDSAWQVA